MPEDLIVKLYDAFNRRDVDEVLTYFHPEVEWPNAWEGGYVTGHAAVRDYWSRQWKELDPKVTPVHFTELENGIDVEVIQDVKDLDGNLLTHKLIRHFYIFKDQLIKRMEIRD